MLADTVKANKLFGTMRKVFVLNVEAKIIHFGHVTALMFVVCNANTPLALPNAITQINKTVLFAVAEVNRIGKGRVSWDLHYCLSAETGHIWIKGECS